ncbi:MAG: hypothetical protein OHK0039_33640 [Bacteroidia bacterium]
MGLLHAQAQLQARMLRRHKLARFITAFLFDNLAARTSPDEGAAQRVVNFSVLELQQAYPQEIFEAPITIGDIENALFFLLKMDILKIEGGFLVVYQRMIVERLEENTKRQYKNEDHEKLKRFYQNRVQQIHIVGAYAQKMLQDYQGAQDFVNDYFTLSYSLFLRKYFPGSKQEDINRTITKKNSSRYLVNCLRHNSRSFKTERHPVSSWRQVLAAARPGYSYTSWQPCC